MSRIHIVAQGKGGVGKSLLAYFIAQYLQDHSRYQAFDTDPLNPTLSQYKSLNVESVQLLEDNMYINARALDVILSATENLDSELLVDVGSGSFLPLLQYFMDNDVYHIWKEYGHEVIFHTILCGSGAFSDTIKNFAYLMQTYTEDDPVLMNVWLNSYFGPVELQGIDFLSTPAYSQFKSRINSIVNMPVFKGSTGFGEDFSYLINHKLTFSECFLNDSFSFPSKQRYKTMQRRVYSALEETNCFSSKVSEVSEKKASKAK